MTRGVPVLDPTRDLKGATPEKLAKALFRRVVPLRPAKKKAAVAETPAASGEIPAISSAKSGHSS